MKRLLSSLLYAALGVLAYLFLPDLLRSMAAWPWGKILQIAGLLVPLVCVSILALMALAGLVEVGSAIIRIADKIAPAEKK